MDSTDPHLQAEINLVEILSKGLKNLKINREEAILIMGNSGGGKSTLCSIFLKMILEAFMDDFGDNIQLKHKDDNGFPPISKDTITSCTKIPQELQVPMGESTVSVWDLPGFGDNRG